MTDVDKSEILHICHVCDVEIVATYGKFMLFCCKISFVTIYMMSERERMEFPLKIIFLSQGIGFQDQTRFVSNIKQDLFPRSNKISDQSIGM